MMLASVSLELQIHHENMDVYIINLKEMFEATRCNARYDTSKELFHCKIAEGSLVNTYVLRMIGYFKEIRPIRLFHGPLVKR